MPTLFSGGGAYYLISRALGPVFGGTIGLLFFVAQAVATSLYVVGFAESVVDLLQSQGIESFSGDTLNDVRIIGCGISVILLATAYVGIGWYAKCQVGLLIVLVIAMISVFIGSFIPSLPGESENVEAGFVGYAVRNLNENYQLDPTTPDVIQNFFEVFAVVSKTVLKIQTSSKD